MEIIRLKELNISRETRKAPLRLKKANASKVSLAREA